MVLQNKIKTTLDELMKDFKYYRLSLFTFSMSSLIEIMLSGNFKEENILSIKEEIQKLAFTYREVYGECSVYLEGMEKSSVESNLLKGVSVTSKAVGKFIGSIPKLKDGQIDERLQDILDFADIGDFVHQPVKTYSSGMFVRLAFAVAINIDPEILIVDEALSVGDVFFQAKCYHKFEEFKKMGKTILFVSHDLTSIAKYCDRVILLNKGVKLAEGNPKDMVNMYKKLLVHQLDEETLEDVSGKSAIGEKSEDGKAWKKSGGI